jgi:nitroreductase
MTTPPFNRKRFDKAGVKPEDIKTFEDFAYYELIDPDTGETVPLENGATGLMAATSLSPEGAVWFDMRFTLNDIHQVFTDPCPCGRTGFRYKIVGRADDMLKVKGVPVYPAAIEGIIHAFPKELAGAFRIVLEEPPPRVVPPLKLKVEFAENVRQEDLPAIEEKVIAKMKALHYVFSRFTPGDVDQRVLGGINAISSDPEYRTFFRAPALIILAADYRAIGSPELDTGICGENMVLAAHSLGLGTCWVSLIKGVNFGPDRRFVKKVLGLDDPFKIITSLTLGYPAGQVDNIVRREQPRINWVE